MRTLVELVDEFGEAIEADFASHYGEALRDYLLGERPAGEALRKIRMLPRGSATVAHAVAAQEAAPGQPAPDRWRSFHLVTPTVEAMWDLWDAVVATSSGDRKRKAPTHPRTKPVTSKRGRSNAARAAK